MKIELDKLVRIGDIATAAVVKHSTHAWRSDMLFSGYGAKHPVAVLIRRRGKTLAFEIEGSPISMDEFERRYQGQWAAFECMADETASAP